MNWKDLIRGGGSGKGGDPYVNEQSLFATYPLAKKNAAPLKKPAQKAAVAAAANAPGALWKQKPPLPTPRPGGGPGGGTYTGQAPPNPLQAAVDAAGHGYPTIRQDQAGTPRPGGPGGGTYTGQAPANPLQAAVDAAGRGFPQIASDQGYGLPQPTPPHPRVTAYPTIRRDQGYGLPQPTPPHINTPPQHPSVDSLPNASDGANPDAGNWWENSNGGPGGDTRTGQPPDPNAPPTAPTDWHAGFAEPGLIHAMFGTPARERPRAQAPQGLMELMQRIFAGN